MSITRERLSPQESRAAALEAARRLLIELGPQAVTLKAVAAEIGKTHANLLHHFGSAAGLQSALAQLISDRVCAGIAEAVQRSRAGEVDPIEIVERTFDAFGREGAGALAAWMILSGNRDALNPILDSIHQLVDQLGEGHEDRPMRSACRAKKHGKWRGASSSPPTRRRKRRKPRSKESRHDQRHLCDDLHQG